MGIDFGGDDSPRSEAVTVGERGQAGKIPRMEPSPPFLLAVHARQWVIVETSEGLELLPQTLNLSVEPGINNVDEYGNPDKMIRDQESKGFTVLKEAWAGPSDTSDRQPGYVRRFRVQNGFVYHTAWVRYREVAGQHLLERDETRYHAWLRKLLSEGHIKPPDPSVVELMLLRARENADRANSRDTRNNAIAARLAERAEKRLENLEKIQQQGASLSDTQKAARIEFLTAQLEKLKGGA